MIVLVTVCDRDRDRNCNWDGDYDCDWDGNCDCDHDHDCDSVWYGDSDFDEIELILIDCS